MPKIIDEKFIAWTQPSRINFLLQIGLWNLNKICQFIIQYSPHPQNMIWMENLTCAYLRCSCEVLGWWWRRGTCCISLQSRLSMGSGGAALLIWHRRSFFSCTTWDHLYCFQDRCVCTCGSSQAAQRLRFYWGVLYRGKKLSWHPLTGSVQTSRQWGGSLPPQWIPGWIQPALENRVCFWECSTKCPVSPQSGGHGVVQQLEVLWHSKEAFLVEECSNTSPSVSRSTKKNNIVSLLTLVLSTGQTFLGRFYSFQTMERSLPVPPALLPCSRCAAQLELCSCCSWKGKLQPETSRASVPELEVPACLGFGIRQIWGWVLLR